MIALDTLAIRNLHGKGRLRPKFSTINLSPYVLIAVPFAAYNLKSYVFLSLVIDLSITETFAPVSTRKDIPVSLSWTVRRLYLSLFSIASTEDRPICFPGSWHLVLSICRVFLHFLTLCRIFHENNIICLYPLILI